jgi:hypothetical protein
MNATSRRGALAGATAVLAALAVRPAAAAVATDTDAELIAACTAFSALQRRENGFYGRGRGAIEDDDARNAASELIRREQAPWLDRICDLRATTPEGTQAKLVALLLWDPEFRDPNYSPAYWNERLVLSLVDDVREHASPPGAGAPSVRDDAELLALCARFHEVHAQACAAATSDVDRGDALDERWNTSDEIAAIVPRTAEGKRQKAHVALVLLVENRGTEPGDGDASFAITALRDVVGDDADALFEAEEEVEA